ncbi:MAG: zinc ABC transporter substrate-binding protein [Clostridia bacterium]|nr:zinc ABC transporter substrate-binding protein [Clostridia bacterium]
MKKIIAALIALVMIISILASCDLKKKTDGGKIDVVTTIFPEYDWVREIAGDHADITMLLDNGVDLHSYQPTVDDIVKISECDMFIYVGGESDEWVDDVLAEAKNKDMVVINLLEVLGDAVKDEEVVEGMEAEHDHDHDEDEEDHDHEDEDHDHEEEEAEKDEHVWLSLRNAEALCSVIAEKLGAIDADHKDEYKSNADAYIAKLADLDNKYKAAVDSAAVKTLLFGDRFPFRYLVDDYGLNYYAAFVGCSAESEASFETIVFLAGKVDELGLKAIMQIESADGKIANTIKDTTNSKDQAILTLDSMQSTTATDIEGGATYLRAMEKNLEVLKDALR